MSSETITVKTENGQSLEVVVLSKNPDRIEVVIAESLRCVLTPTRTQRAYAGTVRGREIVYERSRAEIVAEIAKHDPRRRRLR